MKASARADLWTRLTAEGIVTGELPPVEAPQSPWPVRAMLGIAGWIGALFVLGFLGVAAIFIFDRAEAAVPAGMICCGAAYALFRMLPRNEFTAQFAFAVSLAGQALLLAGLWIGSGHSESGTAILMTMVEAALAATVPNYLHRVFTTMAANVCLFVALMTFGAPGLATAVAAAGCALIWLDPATIAESPELLEPIGYGFAISALYVDGSLLAGPEFWAKAISHGGAANPAFAVWVGPAAAGAVLVYAAWTLAARVGIAIPSRSGALVLVAAAIAAAGGLAAPGISVSILILILGFANGERALAGLGLLALCGYVSHFYYQLTFTLFVKSMVLVGTGAALLSLRWAMRLAAPAREDAHV